MECENIILEVPQAVVQWTTIAGEAQKWINKRLKELKDAKEANLKEETRIRGLRLQAAEEDKDKFDMEELNKLFKEEGPDNIIKEFKKSQK